MNDTSSRAPAGLLTIREAAVYLRISERQLFNLTKAGELAAVSIGRRGKRYSRRALDEWIKSKEAAHGKSRE